LQQSADETKEAIQQMASALIVKQTGNNNNVNKPVPAFAGLYFRTFFFLHCQTAPSYRRSYSSM
jgi:hypothetical protein